MQEAITAMKTPAYRAKPLRKEIGPYRSSQTVYEAGKERPVDVTLKPGFIEVRVQGKQEKFRVTYQQLYLKGVSNGAGFDPGPRTGRMERGRV
jgi:hypothetical protein